MNIILDTNFLIDCSKYHIDYQEELKEHLLFVLDSTISELEKLINQKTAKHAKLALEILNKKQIKILKTKQDKDTDSLILELKGYSVATNDKLLKQKFKGKIFTIRQKKYIKEIK